MPKTKKTKKQSPKACPHNLGLVDKKIRLTLGIAILFISIITTNLFGIVIAGVIIYTGITQSCWLYNLLGIKTCQKKDCNC